MSSEGAVSTVVDGKFLLAQALFERFPFRSVRFTLCDYSLANGGSPIIYTIYARIAERCSSLIYCHWVQLVDEPTTHDLLSLANSLHLIAGARTRRTWFLSRQMRRHQTKLIQIFFKCSHTWFGSQEWSETRITPTSRLNLLGVQCYTDSS